MRTGWSLGITEQCCKQFSPQRCNVSTAHKEAQRQQCSVSHKTPEVHAVQLNGLHVLFISWPAYHRDYKAKQKLTALLTHVYWMRGRERLLRRAALAIEDAYVLWYWWWCWHVPYGNHSFWREKCKNPGFLRNTAKLSPDKIMISRDWKVVAPPHCHPEVCTMTPNTWAASACSVYVPSTETDWSTQVAGSLPSPYWMSRYVGSRGRYLIERTGAAPVIRGKWSQQPYHSNTKLWGHSAPTKSFFLWHILGLHNFSSVLKTDREYEL